MVIGRGSAAFETVAALVDRQAAETNRQRRLSLSISSRTSVLRDPGSESAGCGWGLSRPPTSSHATSSTRRGLPQGQPFKLEPWQRRFVEKFSRVNGDGERIYKRGMLGVARGNGKTPLAAGLALRELLGASDEPDVILAAAARDQAPVCFEYARGFVESGFLADVLQVGRHEIRNRLNGGVLRTVSADGFVATDSIRAPV
jgi:phage terminase large subunit-like protein